MAYAEAINQTQDEQILLSIIKGRYGESSTLLAVNGIVANIRFRAEAGIEAGYRGVGAPADDLLSAGVAYEENPTITYAPVQGEEYLRQLMSPVPLDLLLLILRSNTRDTGAWKLLVSRINGLRNPDFLRGSSPGTDPRFLRLIELFTDLGDAGALELVKSANEGMAFDLWLDPMTEKDAADIVEVLDLLQLPQQAINGKAVVIPTYLGIRADDSWGIGITTRSTFNLVEIMRAAVQVPEADAAAGLTESYPPIGMVGQKVSIKCSPRHPGGQSLAVKFRGSWFWIDETDRDTRAVFRLLRTLWSMSIASAADQLSAPVLTLPVGN